MLPNNCCLKVCCSSPAGQASWIKPDTTGTPHETLPASPPPAAAALLGRQLIWSSLTACPPPETAAQNAQYRQQIFTNIHHSGCSCNTGRTPSTSSAGRSFNLFCLQQANGAERRSRKVMRQLPHLPLACWVRTLDGLLAIMLSDHCSSNHQTTSAAPQRPQPKSPLIH